MDANLRCVGKMAGESDVASKLGIRGVSGVGKRDDPPIVNGEA